MNSYLREIGYRHCKEGKTVMAFYNLSKIKKTDSNYNEYMIGYRSARNQRIKKNCKEICKKLMGERK